MQISNIEKILNFTVVAMATVSISMATGNGLLCRTFIPDHISYRFAIGMSHYPHLSQFNQWNPVLRLELVVR